MRGTQPVAPGWWAIVIGGIVAAALTTDDAGPILCPYRRCTGGDCPMCGVTRSTSQLLRGDLADSWRIHPMVAVLFVQLPLAAVLVLSGAREQLRTLALLNLTVATGLWVARLINGDAAAPDTLQLPW